MKKRRILFAGLVHETHTFLDETTPLSAFRIALDTQVLARRGDGSLVDGFLSVAEENSWEVVPTLTMMATPSGWVEDDVFEYFWREFAARAKPSLEQGVDGIFLCLHGAMVTPRFPDVEGELLARIRSLPGAERLPLFATLDLHANATARMWSLASGILAYRENPHTDAFETSVRTARMLQRSLDLGVVPVMYSKMAPIVWAPPGTGTANDPMQTLEADARKIEALDPEIWGVNVIAGFSFADTEATGVSFSLITTKPEAEVRHHLDALSEKAWLLRETGVVTYPSVTDVLASLGTEVKGPIVLVEPSDNIGGGAGGDGTGVLRALLECGAQRAVVVINDPESVRRSQAVPVGATVKLEVGGRAWPQDPGPLVMEAQVVSCSDGKFDLEDIHSHMAAAVGRHVDMGPCAVVRYQGVVLLLTSKKTPPFDLGQLRSQGIEPTNMTFIGVKAAVAHRRAYDPIATQSYFVDTPGPCSSDLSRFRFARLRRPIYPLDPAN